MPDITPQSPYRGLGICSYEIFSREVETTPIGRDYLLYNLLWVSGHMRLWLGLSWCENRHHTTGNLLPPSTCTNLSLRPPGYPEEQPPKETDPDDWKRARKAGFAVFASYADCARAWLRRFTDPRLKYVNAQSLWEFCLVYHPFGDVHPVTGEVNDTTTYCNRVVAYVNTIPVIEEPVVATPKIENIQDPTVRAKYGLTPGGVQDILSSTTSWATGRPEGICLHVQQGTTGGSLRDHATAARRASANVYVNLDGTVVQAVPTTSGAWTQGIDPDKSHPSPRGKAFLDQFGVWNANSVVLSIEAEGFAGGDHPQVQLDGILWQIREWQRLFPWIGDNEVLRHADFDQVNRSFCPGWYYEEILKMMDQDGKPPTGVIYPPYLDKGLCSTLFGKVVDAEGRVYEYSETGVLSQYWLKNPDKFHYSELDEVLSYEGGARRYAIFLQGPLLFIGTDGKIVEVG
jgi:hypothetical protein